MSLFHQELLASARPIWEAILAHRFLKETAAGTIPASTFETWMRQDYLFVRAGLTFVALLAARAPRHLSGPLYDAVAALRHELGLFERMAAEKSVELRGATMSPTCHAYCQFLLATAYGASFEEGFTLLYGAERGYLDSWRWVKENLKQLSPYQSFIDHWTSREFEEWVGWIGSALDALAEKASPDLLSRMKEIFLLTARYEYLFWEMAATSEKWPV